MSAPYPTYDDEQEIMYREEDHERETFGICRWCEELDLKEYLVDGYCPRCMEAKGLVRCTNCGKAYVKDFALAVKEGEHTYYYCSKCDLEK